MGLIALVISLIVIFIASIVAHALTKRFWRACLGVGGFSAIAYLSFVFLIRRFALGGFQREVPLVELIAWLGTVALIVGILGVIVAALVGVPFVLDRRLQERERV